jgi:hypothetical protein
MFPAKPHHSFRRPPLPEAEVVRLPALREPGETFSEAILRLVEEGSLTRTAVQRNDRGDISVS